MRRYLLGRLLRTIPVVFGVVTVVFLRIHLLPGDPVEIMLGESAVPAQKEELRRELHLDRPILSRYGSFLAGIPRGDLGVSFRSREPVLGEIARRIPATVLLAATSITVAVLVALPPGVLAAMRRGKAADYLSGIAAMLSLSVPNFLLGPLLVLLFSVQLGLLRRTARHRGAAVGMALLLLFLLAAVLAPVIAPSDPLAQSLDEGLSGPSASHWMGQDKFGRHFLFIAPHLVTAPGAAILLTVMAFNFVGDGLRDALDVREETP